MGKGKNSRQKSCGQAQPEDAAQKDAQSQDSLAEGVQEQQRTPSKVKHALQQALLDSKDENKQLAAESTALREQIAGMEVSWKQEKKGLLDERDSLVSTLFKSRNDMDNLVKMVESARASQRKVETERRQMAKKLKDKEEEVCSLKENLRILEIKTEKVKKCWKADRDMVSEVKQSCDEALFHSNAEWESRWSLRQEEVATELNTLNKNLETLQEETEKKVNQVTQEKDNLVTALRDKEEALVKSMFKISQQENEICLQKMETEKVKKCWEAERNLVSEVKQSCDEALFHSNAEWESRWSLRQEEVATELNTLNTLNKNLETLQEETEKKVNHVTQEKDNLVTALRDKEEALVKSMVKISQQENKIHLQKMENEKVKKCWEAERNLVSEVKQSCDKALFHSNAEWESRWSLRQEEVATELNTLNKNLETLQQEMELKVNQVTQEKDNLVIALRDKEEALVKSMFKISQQENEIRQSDTEWREKYNALEGHLTLEQAEKRASLERMQELENEKVKMEEQWRHKESQMEQEMKLLILKNVELQELALMTDREKAQLKKQEMKAKKEAEKRLKKERKENEKREKKQKEENDKEEKENLKREKKEKKKRENERKAQERKEKRDE